MGFLTKARGLLSLKAFKSGMRFPGRSFVWFDSNKIELEDIAKAVGDGTASDILMTPIRWLQRAIAEAPWVAKDAKGEVLPKNDLIKLLERPNPFYAGDVLMAGTTLSMSLAGNAYWIVAMNDSGAPVEIWYAPHTNVEPRWPDSQSDKFITHYEYRVAGSTQMIPPLDQFGSEEPPEGVNLTEGLAVIHFREGVDLDNLRLGQSPLKGLLREVWTDGEAAAFTGQLLKNNGIPGVIVSPADKDATLTLEEGKIAKDIINTEYTGSGRGKALVMLGPTKVEQFGFSPKELDLSPLRNISEERVTAALGVPAAVVGFGAGLQTTKVGATMKEMRQLAWTNGVIPMQSTIAGEVTRSLAPKFDVALVEFDNTKVEALRENQDTKANRVDKLWRSGVITRAEARTATGFEADEADNVYLVNVLSFGFLPQGQKTAVIAAEKGAKALKAEHDHGATEERIIAAAPKATPRPQVAAMARRLDIIRVQAQAVLEPGITQVFEDLGADTLAVVRAQDLTNPDETVSDGHGSGETKQAGELGPLDNALAERIIDAIDTPAAQAALAEAMGTGFVAVANQVADAMVETMADAVGDAFVLSDAAQQQVFASGGTQAGLIDLSEQTREAVFDALAEGRAKGLTADNLARFIADRVEAGPWRDAQTRARVIARTEGANAANTATLATASGMEETEHVQVFDDRIGHGDPGCIEANGKVITIAEAEAIGLAHPNCTRAFVPINSLLMAEMGL
jgi:phage portal protein BeeE